MSRDSRYADREPCTSSSRVRNLHSHDGFWVLHFWKVGQSHQLQGYDADMEQCISDHNLMQAVQPHDI